MRDELSGDSVSSFRRRGGRGRSGALWRQRAPRRLELRPGIARRGAVRGADRPARGPRRPARPPAPDPAKSWPSSHPPSACLSLLTQELKEIMVFAPGEKPGNEPEEAKLQNASKQIVQNAILQAVQQVSRESRPRGDRSSGSRGRGQLGVQELTKKHEKK